MTAPGPDEALHAFLDTFRPGDVVTGTVAGFEESDVVMDLAGTAGHGIGVVPRHELSRRRFDDPAEIVTVGQSLTTEVIGVDWRRGRVWLSARACEDETLRSFLLSVERGEVRTGVVADVRNFGVFVNLDGEPSERCTGFINVPELSWSHIDHASDVVEAGQRITVEVLDVDTRRGQVGVSLKALQPDPFVPFAERVGQVVAGRVTRVVPFGVFVRVADGVDGLVHVSELSAEPVGSPAEVVRTGDEISVRVVEVDRQLRRVRLTPA